MIKTNLMKKMGTAFLAAMAMSICFGGMSVKASDKQIDGGDTKDAATKLNYNNSYVAQFDGADSQDWYTFTPNGDNSFYEIQIKNINIETGGNGYYGFHAYIMNEIGDIFADIDTHKNEVTTNKFKLNI